MPRLALQTLLPIAASMLLTACGGDGAPSLPAQRLVAVGRVERGATVRLVARDGAAGDTLVSNIVLIPASAGTVTGTVVRLLQTGQVTAMGTASNGTTISAILDVVLPPTVLFDATSSGNRDIYSVALDGGDLKRLTTSPGEDTHPSAAAGTLVFSSTRDGNGELYSMPSLGGGAEKRLTTTAANETQPVINNAGTSVAFTSDAGGLPHVFVAPVSLAGAARLTATSFGFGGSIETDPTWSAAGDRIVFMSTANGRANLFTSAAVAGSSPDTLKGSGSQQTDVEPSWGPDGKRVAFASTRAGGTQIFLFDVASGAYSQATSGSRASGQPGWLPDGRLLFTVFLAGESTLWWVDPASGEPPVEIPTGLKSPAHATGRRP